MNNTIKDLISRRSVRKFKSEMISKDLLDKIIECGTFAPSGMNKQSSIIIAITNKEIRDKIANLNAKILGNEGDDPFYGAPVVLVVLADKKCLTHVYDGSLVMGNLMNAAHSLGIGSCWIHRAKEVFETDEGLAILNSLGINGEYEGIGNCILGYPSTDLPTPLKRKDNYIYYI